MRRRVQSLTGSLLVALATAGFLAASAPAAETGAVADITWWGQPRSVVDREIKLLDDAGVKWVRAIANWRELEPRRKGEIDQERLAAVDYAVGKALDAGLNVVMPIEATPYWASTDPNKQIAGGEGRWDWSYPPADPRDYGDFARFVVNRYSPRGVHVYEIWNEPNIARFWGPTPDAGEYAALLRAGYLSIKQASPTATVLLGGLCYNDFVYLEQLYAAGAGPYFDAVAVHPYTNQVPTVEWRGHNDGAKGDPDRLSWYSFPALREIRSSMVANGDSDKQVWITEFGYSTSNEYPGVTQQQQADYLLAAFRYVEQFPWIKAMLWYAARDNPFGDPTGYEARFGLFTLDFELKPSYEALVRYNREQAAAQPPQAAPSPGTSEPTFSRPWKRRTRHAPLRDDRRRPRLRGRGHWNVAAFRQSVGG